VQRRLHSCHCTCRCESRSLHWDILWRLQTNESSEAERTTKTPMQPPPTPGI